MLRKIVTHINKLYGNPSSRLYFLAKAIDNFCFSTTEQTKTAPFIRDNVDLKRWMILVVFALLPAIFMAIWNTGVYNLLLFSEDLSLINNFSKASSSFKNYFNFIYENKLVIKIIISGACSFLPIVSVSYIVGGIWEIIFSSVRRHPIAEGFLVTGILFPLTLPPTIPLWMVAVGISFGVVIGKEIFGGTGLNIFNPALCGRSFLFFSFPTAMTGNVWIGPCIKKTSNALQKLSSMQSPYIDSISSATCLQTLTSSSGIKKIHTDAFAIYHELKIPICDLLITQYDKWKQFFYNNVQIQNLSYNEFCNFISSPLNQGGLGLLPEKIPTAKSVSNILHSIDQNSTFNLLLGNHIGSLGETSSIACALGGAFLILTGIASFKIIASCICGALFTAFIIKFCVVLFSDHQGALMPASYFLPAYKHLIIGGFAFGTMFMATDPVSAPCMKFAKILYGAFIGCITVIIRLFNPAYPEGVMLAILLGNCFSPLFDFFASKRFEKQLNKRIRNAKKQL